MSDNAYVMTVTWYTGVSATKQAKVQQGSPTDVADSAPDEIAADMELRGRKPGSASASLSSSRANTHSAASDSLSSRPQGELVNQKALNIVQRVRDKLTGLYISVYIHVPLTMIVSVLLFNLYHPSLILHLSLFHCTCTTASLCFSMHFPSINFFLSTGSNLYASSHFLPHPHEYSTIPPSLFLTCSFLPLPLSSISVLLPRSSLSVLIFLPPDHFYCTSFSFTLFSCSTCYFHCSYSISPSFKSLNLVNSGRRYSRCFHSSL